MILKVSADRKISDISPMIYGQFMEHFHKQIYDGIYNPKHPLSDEDGFRTDVLEALKKIKTPIIRWPGGCFASAYHWKNAVGQERVPMFDKAWRVEDTNHFGTDEYMKLCRKLNCEPYICTNAGTGTSREMSDWVEYCNLDEEGFYAKWRISNGYKNPHKVKYWSIGNENYGDWEIGAKTAAEWGRFVCESAKMMKRVDPAIELSAASLTDMEWNMELLKNCGKRLSWISLHGYWDFHDKRNKLANYDRCMAYTKDLEEPVRKTRGLLCALGLEHNIKIAYDEWNLRAWYHPNIMDLYQGIKKEEYLYPREENEKNSQYTMADAVFSACFLNMCIRNSDIVGMANFSPTVNTRGLIYTCEEGVVLRSTYHVFELYVNELGSQLIDSWNLEECGLLEVMDSNYNSVQVPEIDYAATYRKNDNITAIAIVNKNPNEARKIRIASEGAVFQKYRMLSVNGPCIDSYNDIGVENVTLSYGDWVNCNNRIELYLKEHSVNILQIAEE